MTRCTESKDIFKGVFPSDELPHLIPPYSFIANVDSHSKPGSHWVAFYAKNDVIEFFDSYGRSPYSSMFSESFGNFISNWPRCIYNSRILEGFLSSTCGQFCIFYLCSRSRGYTFNTVVESLSNNSVAVNDYIVKKFK